MPSLNNHITAYSYSDNPLDLGALIMINQTTSRFFRWNLAFFIIETWFGLVLDPTLPNITTTTNETDWLLFDIFTKSTTKSKSSSISTVVNELAGLTLGLWPRLNSLFSVGFPFEMNCESLQHVSTVCLSAPDVCHKVPCGYVAVIEGHP